MGKVYEFSDIAGNRVPKPDNFIEAKTTVLTELSDLASRGEIYGAKIFGSVAKGAPNERSDFDLLVITSKDTALGQLRDIVARIRNQTNVDIEPLVVDEEFAARGFHSIEDLFLDHIRDIPVEGNVAGRDPMEIIRSFGLPVAIVHKQYLAQKLRRLREGVFTHSNADRIKILQRALEAPVNVGRRTLQVLFSLRDIVLSDDRKPAVIQAFRKTFQNTNLMLPFEYLLDRDNFYTAYLRETMQRNVSEQEYQTTIATLVTTVFLGQ